GPRLPALRQPDLVPPPVARRAVVALRRKLQREQLVGDAAGLFAAQLVAVELLDARDEVWTRVLAHQRRQLLERQIGFARGSAQVDAVLLEERQEVDALELVEQLTTRDAVRKTFAQ